MPPRATERQQKHGPDDKPAKLEDQTHKRLTTAPVDKPRSSNPSTLGDSRKYDESSAKPGHYVAAPQPQGMSDSVVNATIRGLPSLVQGFLGPSSGDYKGCEVYCRKYPALWSQDVSKFPDIAVTCMRGPNAEQGLRFAERWRMVDYAQKKGYTADQANEYLRKLRNNITFSDAFEEELSTIITDWSIETKGKGIDNKSESLKVSRPTGIASPPATSQGHLDPSADALQPDFKDLKLNNVKGSLPRQSKAKSQTDILSTQEAPVAKTTSQPHYIQAKSPDTRRDDEEELDADTVENATVVGQEAKIDSNTAGIGPNLKFLANYDKKDELDKSYRVRENPEAKSFFVKGRVFAMVWHENAGVKRFNVPQTAKSLEQPFHTHTVTRDGIEIFSHIRRFVIIKARQGYCWAIPINSYGGRGLTVKHMSKGEQQAHTIVHARGSQPRYMKGEVRLDKKPIAVDMAHGQTLTPSSRLHFDKPQSINWNIRVREVGMITGDTDLGNLIFYFKQEFARSEDVRTEAEPSSGH